MQKEYGGVSAGKQRVAQVDVPMVRLLSNGVADAAITHSKMNELNSFQDGSACGVYF